MEVDIAAAATQMKSSQTAQAACVAVMKKTMDTQASIAMNVIDSLMELDVGARIPRALDIQI